MKQLVIGGALALAGPVTALTTALAMDALLFATPVLADVKTGVDAWAQGDYARALREWRPLAQAGDPDAQFNLGQAYKLGRGVPVDIDTALDWFRRAADQGHARAQDNYGLLLFQQDRRQQAMPYIQKSASRGEARAQYILGTALFNGEYVGKDWVRAYALMTRASSSGLSQAAASLEQMDKFIPADQRQKGLALATQMESTDKAALLASIESPSGGTAIPGADAPKANARPVRTADLPPSGQYPSSSSPANPPRAVQPKPAAVKPAPDKGQQLAARPATTKPSAMPASVAPPAKSGGWRVQLGAFSEDGRAKTLWTSLSGRVSGLSAYQPYLVKGGAVTRLQAGPIGSAADAEKLCRAIRATGTDCLTKKM